MRIFAMCVLLFVWLQASTPSPKKNGQSKQQQAASAQQPAAQDLRGTEQSPIVVKILETTNHQEETPDETANRKQKSASDWTTIFTGLLVLSAFLQVGVYLWQAILLRKTVKSAGEQSEAMERHIGEANRSANAMENVEDAIRFGNRAIMRAYLSVVIGSARPQNRADGIRFEGKPSLVNTGSTPARNVHIKIAGQIVPAKEAEGFPYPVPDEIAKASATAAPHQTYILSAIVKDFIPDGQVPGIKQGQTGALTVWGIVTYDDIFGEHHTTKFAQWLFFNADNTVYGSYIPGQNEMD